MPANTIACSYWLSVLGLYECRASFRAHGAWPDAVLRAHIAFLNATDNPGCFVHRILDDLHHIIWQMAYCCPVYDNARLMV